MNIRTCTHKMKTVPVMGDKRSSSQNDVKIVILIKTLSKLRVMALQVKCVIFAGPHTKHYRQS